MGNSQSERDFDDLGALKRPGRLDFKTLNNVDDAGDGYPGMQKAIRNYFHEGYLEKDINMNTHKIVNLQAPSNNNDGARKTDVDAVQNDLDGFDDELKSLSAVEVQQLQNIDSVTISGTQWGYVGVLNQNLRTSDNVVFSQVTVGAGNLIVGTRQLTDGEWQQLTNINTKTITETQWGYLGASNQGIATSDTPSFTGLTLSADLVLVANGITGTSVDISNAELQQLSNIASATISGVQWGYLGALDQSLAQAQSPTFMGLNLSANLVTTSTVDGVNVSTFKSNYDTHVGNTNAHIDNLTDITTRNHDDLANKDANSDFLHSTSAEQTNWGVAFTHKSNDGSDHSFIDQAVTIAGTPTFGSLTITNNITVGGTVDGVDIAARDHDKYTDAEALAASYKGIGSTTVRHSHDTEKQLSQINAWYKVKEITIHESIKCDIYWEVKSTQSTSVDTRIRRNGVNIGSIHETSSTSYVPFTESDHIFVRGDTIELWGQQFSVSGSLWVQNFRLKYDTSENTF